MKKRKSLANCLRHPAVSSLRPPPPGVTVHAAVCGVCDPQPGRVHALLSERADGQVHADLPGVWLPLSQCVWGLRGNNDVLCVCVCVGGERSLRVLRPHSFLLHQWGDHAGPLSERRLSLSQASAEGGWTWRTEHVPHLSGWANLGFLRRIFCSARVVSAFCPPSSARCPPSPAASTSSLWIWCTWWVLTWHLTELPYWLAQFGNGNWNGKRKLPHDLFHFLPVVGATSLPLSQPRVHHSAGCLPHQHHGLWGVCPSHSSPSLLPPWVHLQLWNWRSKVPLCTLLALSVCNAPLLTQPVWYSAVASPTTAPWRAPFLYTPPTAPLLMRLWWDRKPQARWACVPCQPEHVCICQLWQLFLRLHRQGNHVWSARHWAVWWERNIDRLQRRRWETPLGIVLFGFIEVPVYK